MSNTVRITGLNDTVRTLKKLGVDVQDLKSAFTRIGSRIEAGAKQRVPVRSGQFKGSIKQSQRQNSVYLYAGGRRAWHAPYVEFGTRYTRAQEPMQRTLRANRRWGLEQVESELNKLIRKYGLS